MFSYQRRLFFPVQAEGPDPHFAKILLEHYGGRDSEFSAGTQYLNHRSNMPNPYVRDLLGMIAAEEMGHMEMIAVAIRKLEGTPLKYINSQGIPWNISYIDQSIDPLKMLEADEGAEIRAKKLYSKHLAMTNDLCLKRMIEFLIQREEVHQKLFRKAGILLAQDGDNEQFSFLIHEYRRSLRIVD